MNKTMTLREFRFALRMATKKGDQPTMVARNMMTKAQRARLYTPAMTRERNLRKRSPSYWSRIFIEQCWRIMFPRGVRK